MKKIYLTLFIVLWSVSALAVPLSNKLAFPLKITQINPHKIKLDWSLPDGYFIYKKSILIALSNQPNLKINPPTLPASITKMTNLGTILEIYRNHLNVIVNLPAAITQKDTITIKFQGCADAGYCYPPITVKHHITQTSRSNSSKLWQLLVFYGFGLLLSFTPCVLPMIPILSGLIVGQRKPASTRKAFLLSLSYVMSMSVMYSIIGGFIALMGANLQIAMQAPGMIIAFSGLCFVIGLSMFDVYQFKLPLACQRFLSGMTQHQAGGEYLGAAVMGALSILILSPCVTAPMIGALGYVAQTGSGLFGFFALFALGLGMGTPLLVIGTSAGKILPKTGPWMNMIKHFFGLVFFALGLHLISRFLPPPLTMGIWAGLLMFCSLYLRPFQRATCASETITQTLGLMGFIYSILILIGCSLGHQNPWLPLVTSVPAVEHTVTIKDNRITSPQVLERALSNALGKPVLIYFSADWCASCKWVHDYLLQQTPVQTALKSFVILQVDITQQNQNSTTLLKKYGVIAPPTFIFLNAQGQEQTSMRITGEPKMHDLINNLNSTKTQEL